jgi:hypothetical protein
MYTKYEHQILLVLRTTCKGKMHKFRKLTLLVLAARVLVSIWIWTRLLWVDVLSFQHSNSEAKDCCSCGLLNRTWQSVGYGKDARCKRDLQSLV